MTSSVDEQFREVMNLMREGNAVKGISLLKDIWTHLSEGQFTMSIQHFDEFIIAPLDALLDEKNFSDPIMTAYKLEKSYRNNALLLLDKLAEMLDSTPAEFLRYAGSIKASLGIAYSRVGVRYFNFAKNLDTPEVVERLDKATTIFAKSIPLIENDSTANVSLAPFQQTLTAMKNGVAQLKGY